MRMYSTTIGVVCAVLVLAVETVMPRDAVVTTFAVGVPVEFESALPSAAGCIGCDICAGGQHRTYATGSRNVGPGSEHLNCGVNGPSCDTWHTPNPLGCGGDEAFLDDATRARTWLVINGNDVDAKIRVLADHPAIYQFNEERGSIQVFACNGDLIANVPQSLEHLMALR